MVTDIVDPDGRKAPPGDRASGAPPVDFARLQRWARKRGGNAAAYQALINLAYRWGAKGSGYTRPAARAAHTGCATRDPKVYDRLSDRDRDLLCFPPSTVACYRRREHATGGED